MQNAALHIAKFVSNIGNEKLAIRSDRLAKMLLQRPSSHPKQTVSDFTEWIFRADHPKFHLNQRGPSSLAKARRQISNVLDRLAGGQAGAWELVSCDTGKAADPIYNSPALLVRGHPIRMKPDAIFRHPESGLIVIIEYKVPNFLADTPSNGWPNLAAQLWAYSWGEPWIDSPNVLLLGACFDEIAGECVLRSTLPRTLKTDNDLNAACRKLFLAWGGEINSNAVRDKNLRKLLSQDS